MKREKHSMDGRTMMGMALALALVCSAGTAGEKDQKKQAKSGAGCCAEMTKASSADAKSCNDKGMKGAAGDCDAAAKTSKAKAGASAGCCEKGTKAKASADKAAPAPSVASKDKK
jgi:hypothetical protein